MSFAHLCPIGQAMIWATNTPRPTNGDLRENKVFTEAPRRFNSMPIAHARIVFVGTSSSQL